MAKVQLRGPLPDGEKLMAHKGGDSYHWVSMVEVNRCIALAEGIVTCTVLLDLTVDMFAFRSTRFLWSTQWRCFIASPTNTTTR